MAGETVLTVIGNLTDDPELTFTPSGAAVANFTVASTPRTLDRQTNEWKDGNPLFIRCSVWRQVAENVAESLQKGQQVIVHGALNIRNYERKDGSKGTSVEMNVYEVGPSLRFATAKVTKATRSGGGGGGGQSGGQANPWAQQPAAQGGSAEGGSAPQQSGSDAWAGGGGSTDEPPF